jgi:ribosomal protein S18 acetylase RimI-like enzyme
VIVTTRHKRTVRIRYLETIDTGALSHYLQQLSVATTKRFAPHPFDAAGISTFYHEHPCTGYIAVDLSSMSIVGYAVVRKGLLSYEEERLLQYGFNPQTTTTACSFAPSVADAWQGEGIGWQMLQYIVKALADEGITRILLWGGVQADNNTAIHFYQRNGFRIIGHFHYQGENYDMLLEN